ncbi:transposase [Fibrella rubiginis]|uniref:transposase n=1 Tax=Fibrella rubiginis TaxID=2817060 RepID=UPI001E30A424|nr:transposase [Fibrella rubiginis]
MTKQWKPLTNPQWANRPAARLKRKRKHDLRQIINIILWLLRTGCQWRNLPPCWPPWQAVHYYFDQWKKAYLFEHINTTLNQLDRQQAGREPFPSVLCVDTQSVKLAPMIWEFRGKDAHKLVNDGPPLRP